MPKRRVVRCVATLDENLDLLIASAVHIHIFLLPVGRKADPPRGAPIIGKTAPSLEPDIVFEVSHLVEDLDPVALPVTDVDQAFVAEGNAMYNLYERTTHTRICFFFCPLVPPLTKELSRSIENSYAAVAIAVGDVDVSIAGITANSEGMLLAIFGSVFGS